ncbi:ATP-binding protein [Rossellomorea aquimaris]|uniref:ATP-binding protein n=1 Tax=Rossellomorea TaxID=2837508 RepID=UPI00165344FA|nr:ATP-binding protein [Rossellomorea vietnamensis]
MRRLIDKVFKDSQKDKEKPEAMSLPFHLSYGDIQYRTKRGFLAGKLAQYAGKSPETGDQLFYSSLKLLFVDQESKDDLFYLFLSESMLRWAEKGLDIRWKIENMPVKTEIQNAMFKAYDMYRKEFFSFPEKNTNFSYEMDDRQEGSQWEVYRDVILASSQGKLLLISELELKGLKKGRTFCEGSVKELADIPKCRHLAKSALEEKGYKEPLIMGWLLALSEAITNTIKHGEEGKMILIDDEGQDEIRFIIEDRGPGFPLKDLPNATLLGGYSTKKSLGQGFTLMQKMTKQICLYTTSAGSTVVLRFNRQLELEQRI